jgi:AraC family transcriptional regulator
MTTVLSRARLRRLLLETEPHLHEHVDLASMALQFGASPFHFHRLFREFIGETPRQYIERLRLERALERLARTNERILDICHTIGFRSHETFSRAFKRRYRLTPTEARQFAQWRLAKGLEMEAPLAQGQYRLSKVRFESLQPFFLLAKRRVGDYSSFDYAPFNTADRLWNPLVRWAARHRVNHAKTACGLTHDIPGLTPPAAQRFDGCIRIDRAVTGSRDFKCLRFNGGTYAVIEHAGPASTILAAYRRLLDALDLARDRYVWREGPSLTIYRAVRIGGNSLLNKTAVCLPVSRLQHRKKRQSLAASQH